MSEKGDSSTGDIYRMRPVRSFGEITVFRCRNCGTEEKAHPEHSPKCRYCNTDTNPEGRDA